MALVEVGQFFTAYYAQIMRILNLQLPLFGFTIWQFWVGCLGITLSVKLLSKWLWDEEYNSRFGHYRYTKKGD